MSVLVDADIRRAIKDGDILITPFNERSLGTNSYDVHLAPTMLVYKYVTDAWHRREPLDCKKDNPTIEVNIDDPRGYVLMPGELYLSVTREYTETHRHLPFLEGKSSLGRLGLNIHVTAGKGDVGFCGHWTMEMTVVRPLRIYAGMPVGQLIYHEVAGTPDVPYYAKASQKYTERGYNPNPRPVASAMYKNFPKES